MCSVSSTTAWVAVDAAPYRSQCQPGEFCSRIKLERHRDGNPIRLEKRVGRVRPGLDPNCRGATTKQLCGAVHRRTVGTACIDANRRQWIRRCPRGNAENVQPRVGLAQMRRRGVGQRANQTRCKGGGQRRLRARADRSSGSRSAPTYTGCAGSDAGRVSLSATRVAGAHERVQLVRNEVGMRRALQSASCRRLFVEACKCVHRSCTRKCAIPCTYTRAYANVCLSVWHEAYKPQEDPRDAGPHGALASAGFLVECCAWKRYGETPSLADTTSPQYNIITESVETTGKGTG